ncbi:hypothetical protein P153DRAFT_193877 [Dothidotthia symphoricarpi CBS 119687]|uniref:C2H2-type domain-containing protein n=1 Tax=Dothidotthia symphoricarpi CBS 119687 TaxID=1392245 RepID=A0A6A6ALN4_9PLEO|nr:uncharacterized protein P153DRAFT_193877 [Dothidotthia symphoricarpi CBS 119687]KAF2131381.1 hypothetical protein P153DRAFT_193877 [Dothidotthia symphoricarpi CBS 119687]
MRLLIEKSHDRWKFDFTSSSVNDDLWPSYHTLVTLDPTTTPQSDCACSSSGNNCGTQNRTVQDSLSKSSRRGSIREWFRSSFRRSSRKVSNAHHKHVLELPGTSTPQELLDLSMMSELPEQNVYELGAGWNSTYGLDFHEDPIDQPTQYHFQPKMIHADIDGTTRQIRGSITTPVQPIQTYGEGHWNIPPGTTSENSSFTHSPVSMLEQSPITPNDPPPAFQEFSNGTELPSGIFPPLMDQGRPMGHAHCAHDAPPQYSSHPVYQSHVTASQVEIFHSSNGFGSPGVPTYNNYRRQSPSDAEFFVPPHQAYQDPLRSQPFISEPGSYCHLHADQGLDPRMMETISHCHCQAAVNSNEMNEYTFATASQPSSTAEWIQSEGYSNGTQSRALIHQTDDSDVAPEAHHLPVSHPTATYPPVKCGQCRKLFIGKFGAGNLTRHIRHVHNMMKIVCRVCEKSFKRGDALRKHRWTKHHEEDARPKPKKVGDEIMSG